MLAVIKKNQINFLLSSGSYSFKMMKEKRQAITGKTNKWHTKQKKQQNAQIIHSTDKEPNLEELMNTSRLLATNNP